MNMNKPYKYVIFSPYFGKLPDMFDLWAQSCGHNPQFLFIVFTDANYTRELPANVQMIQMSFSAMQNLVQSKFDFSISLNFAYKLCDYKPAFGYIFEDYIRNCEYWGYCDMDLIFGNISQFMPKKKYDKISHLGHLCLYKNTPEINRAFMRSSDHFITYRNIFSSAVHFAFDENDDYGINAIFRFHQWKIYPFENYIADVRGDFSLSRYQNPGFSLEPGMRVFLVQDGRVYAHILVNNNIEKTEYAYVHMQKRRMNRQFYGIPERYLITTTGFESWQQITTPFIESCQQHLSSWKYWYQKLSVKRIALYRALRRKWEIAKIRYFAKRGNRDSTL